jgi:aspartate kinase
MLAMLFLVHPKDGLACQGGQAFLSDVHILTTAVLETHGRSGGADRKQRLAMARIVMKFGGTSMAGTERIRGVAARVKREIDAGNQVAVVVSAMAGETDRLVGFCREASPLADVREYDVVVAAGEQITAGLLAITLQGAGVKARSWLGWQLPIRTSAAHSVARIEGIDTEHVLAAMAAGEVAVVPGFQGLSDAGRVTTLGRGGSDTSAVALAAALKADRCDIYTDVDGVYTTDPRIVPRARKLERITYEEMLELALRVCQVRFDFLHRHLLLCEIHNATTFLEPFTCP